MLLMSKTTFYWYVASPSLQFTKNNIVTYAIMIKSVIDVHVSSILNLNKNINIKNDL